jgi:hypothetical protein
MAMPKNVLPMLKPYQVINFLTKIPTYVCERRMCMKYKHIIPTYFHHAFFTVHVYQSKHQMKKQTFFLSFAH